MKQDEPIRFPVTASTHWDGKRLFYVADLPRKVRVGKTFKPKPGFADWEYTENPANAIKLSRYWWRRFRADSHHCNRCAHWA